MKYTPQERLRRLLELEASDSDCMGAKAEIMPGYQLLEAYTDVLPKEISSKLWAYPTALYIYHHRLLELVCETMRFPEED